MPGPTPWVYIKGDGLAVDGACTLYGVYAYLGNNGNQCNVYDGRNATQGKQVCHLALTQKGNVDVTFPNGLVIENGVYLDQSNDNDLTLVVFEQ